MGNAFLPTIHVAKGGQKSIAHPTKLINLSVSNANGEETIHKISARKADKTERRIYEQGQ